MTISAFTPVTAGQQIILPDGRRLGFSEYGIRAGIPIFYFHGCPGSRLDALLAEPVARRFGVRLIALDRPGFGLSDYQEKRTIGKWPFDVSFLADALAIGRFAVLGVSGGGPYAAACASLIPHRLTAAGIVCGIAPPDMPEPGRGMAWRIRAALFLGRHAPLSMRLICGAIGWYLVHFPERALTIITAVACPADKEVLSGQPTRSIIAYSFKEAVRNGSSGVMQDLYLLTHPWGFRLETIPIMVQLWQGELDVTVPSRMARHLVGLIPGCKVTYYPRDGHFSLPVNHMDEIIQGLIPTGSF